MVGQNGDKLGVQASEVSPLYTMASVRGFVLSTGMAVTLFLILLVVTIMFDSRDKKS